jgi:hypothetical protein
MDRDQKAQQPGHREVSSVSTRTTVVTLFLAAMLQWAAILAVCPSVHELVHHDADDEHHDCAVTLFLTGQVEQALTDPIIIGRPASIELFLRSMGDSAGCGSFFLGRSILEHAPPTRK